MKVVCINNQYDRYNYKSYLTIGKIYDGNYDRDYLIIWIALSLIVCIIFTAEAI